MSKQIHFEKHTQKNKATEVSIKSKRQMSHQHRSHKVVIFTALLSLCDLNILSKDTKRFKKVNLTFNSSYNYFDKQNDILWQKEIMYTLPEKHVHVCKHREYLFHNTKSVFCHTVKDQRDFTAVFFVLQ